LTLLYDEAVLDFLRQAFNSAVNVVPVSEFWRVIAMKEEGGLQLPAICISRNSNTKDNELNSWVIGRRGRVDRVQGHRLINEQAIPMQLTYNLTLLASTQDDIDELTSESIFLISNKPRVSVKIPYGSERETHAQIHVSGEITDTSTRDMFSDTGILYQSIIPIKMLGANIFNLEKKNLRYLKWSVGTEISNIKEEIEDAEN